MSRRFVQGGPDDEAREQTARAVKVDRLLAELTLICPTVSEQQARNLDAEGWEALEALAGTRPASELTRAALLRRLRERDRLIGIITDAINEGGEG